MFVNDVRLAVLVVVILVVVILVATSSDIPFLIAAGRFCCLIQPLPWFGNVVADLLPVA